WFADPWLSVGVGVLFFAVGYYAVAYRRIGVSLGSLPRRERAVGALGLVASSLVLGESSQVFGLTDHETYLYAATMFAQILLFASFAGVRRDR
ncbi:hypothetical protein, partial [Halarchaeum acidiphilum]